MKHLFILTVLIASFQLNAQTKLSIAIDHVKTDSILIQGLTVNYGESFQLTEKGTAKLTLDLPQSGIYVIVNNKRMAPIYLTNKQKSGIELDADTSFIQQYKLSGQLLKENTFLMETILELGDTLFADDLYKHDENTFIEEVDAYVTRMNNRMTAMSLDTSFIAAYNTYIQSQVSTAKMVYATQQEMAKLQGEKAPDFAYEDLQGNTIHLSDFNGKYVYIDLWATWCKPCIAEIPSLTQMEHDYASKNIVFISISVDNPEHKQKWIDFVTQRSLEGVQVFSDNGFRSDFPQHFGLKYIPRFMLIGTEGEILEADAPRPSSDDIRTLLDGLPKL